LEKVLKADIKHFVIKDPALLIYASIS